MILFLLFIFMVVSIVVITVYITIKVRGFKLSFSMLNIFRFTKTCFDKYFSQKKVVSKREQELKDAQVRLDGSKIDLSNYKDGAKAEIKEILEE